MSEVWRVRLRIGVNGSEYENAGIITDDPYAAVAEAIGEILPSVQVQDVARFIDIDAGWEPVYGSAEERPAEQAPAGPALAAIAAWVFLAGTDNRTHLEQVTIPRDDLSVLLAAAALLAANETIPEPAPEAVRSRLGDLLARYDVRLDVT